MTAWRSEAGVLGEKALNREGRGERRNWQARHSHWNSLIILAHYLRCLTTVRAILGPRDYTQGVRRHYTMERVKGGMKFTCTRCAHHVSTLDFDSRDGNLRTQAASAINQHATSVHHEPVMFSSLDAQQRVWRA